MLIPVLMAARFLQPFFGVQTQNGLTDVVYLPTPQPVVDAMLAVAKVTERDVVHDLGSGDGRLVITAAQRYGARAIGSDIDPQRIAEATENAKAAGVLDRVQFRQENLFAADVREATVVTLYLLTSLNLRLRSKLLMDLQPGTRIVSHAFSMGDWLPACEVCVRMFPHTDNFFGGISGYMVYGWTVPSRNGGGNGLPRV